MNYSSQSLFKFVFDASSLINIERKRNMPGLRRRRGEILVPKKVAEEVNKKGTPLHRFLENNPHLIVGFTTDAEELYLEIRGQDGIHDGEAAAIALALKREHPLVMDDGMGRRKAKNHSLRCLTWEEFVKGSY